MGARSVSRFTAAGQGVAVATFLEVLKEQGFSGPGRPHRPLPLPPPYPSAFASRFPFTDCLHWSCVHRDSPMCQLHNNANCRTWIHPHVCTVVPPGGECATRQKAARGLPFAMQSASEATAALAKFTVARPRRRALRRPSAGPGWWSMPGVPARTLGQPTRNSSPRGRRDIP